MRTLTRPHTGQRRGFTLVELLISIVLFALVMGTMVQILTRQQRFYRGAAGVMDMRSQLRQAVFVLPMDLRPITPADGDVYAWSESGISFRAVSGSAILCAAPTTSTLILPPTTLTNQNALTSWHTAPVVGDSILIYDEGMEVGSVDDVWQAHEITAVTTIIGVGACTTVTGFTTVGDAGTPSHQITISPTLSSTVTIGAPIRVFRSTTYELYQAADGDWYLGASDCLPGRTPVCSAPSAVSGPYRELSATPGESGLELSYFDALGNLLTPGVSLVADIARIEVVVRGQTDIPFAITSAPAGHYQDSLSFTVGLRNR